MHILLITRFYPPAISGGARRPYLYVKALRALEHRVTVVLPFESDDPDCLIVGNSAINRGDKMLRNQKAASGLARLIATLKAKLRLLVYWPDDNIGWVRDVIRTVKQTDLSPDWIVTTSPPESIHKAGAALSAHLDTPWLAEFRDTWVVTPHRTVLAQSKLRARIEAWMARRTIQQAAAITAVSDAVMAEARTYAQDGTPECIISHFSDPPPAPFPFDPSRLNLVHTGGFSLSDRRRTLPPLLKFMDETAATRDDMVFHIAGPLSAEEQNLIGAARTTVEWHGSVSLAQSRALQAGADGLVLYTPTNSHALPGKYAEYALSGRPILYHGGGDWLSLVEPGVVMQPLETGLLSLEKNQLPRPPSGLRSVDAAQTLATFLASLEAGSRRR